MSHGKSRLAKKPQKNMKLGVTKSIMPNGRRCELVNESGRFGVQRREVVHVILKSSAKKYSPRETFFHKIIRWVKFNKNIIVNRKFMDRKKIMCDLWDMKNIVEFKIPREGWEHGGTSGRDGQTFSITNTKPVKISITCGIHQHMIVQSDVMGRTTIRIPRNNREGS